MAAFDVPLVGAHRLGWRCYINDTLTSPCRHPAVLRQTLGVRVLPAAEVGDGNWRGTIFKPSGLMNGALTAPVLSDIRVMHVLS